MEFDALTEEAALRRIIANQVWRLGYNRGNY